MKDRSRIVAGILAALWVATALWGFNQYGARAQLNIHLNNRYQQEFEDLVSSVENIEIALGKSLVSGSMRNNIIHLSEVARHAEMAQYRLGNLPLPQRLRNRTATFLAQVSDSYSHGEENASAVSCQSPSGIPCPDPYEAGVPAPSCWRLRTRTGEASPRGFRIEQRMNWTKRRMI